MAELPDKMLDDSIPQQKGQSRLLDSESESVCSECFGTGTKVDPVKGAMPCVCTRRNQAKRLLVAAHIPRRYVDCTFENFKTQPGTSQDNALLYARTLVIDYPAVDRGLLLMGNAGVGKTHLGVAVIKGLINKGFGCVFSESGSLLKQIQDSYNPISKSSELKVLEPIYTADVLVLDELGATIPTDWVRDTMYQIINKRYNDHKLTIFTTNYFDELPSEKAPESQGGKPTFSRKANAERYRDIATLEDRIGTRLRSRLYEMCTRVVVEGEDYRTHMGRRRFDVTRP